VHAVVVVGETWRSERFLSERNSETLEVVIPQSAVYGVSYYHWWAVTGAHRPGRHVDIQADEKQPSGAVKRVDISTAGHEVPESALFLL
jgi:hypothetical protein